MNTFRGWVLNRRCFQIPIQMQMAGRICNHVLDFSLERDLLFKNSEAWFSPSSQPGNPKGEMVT